jgi:pyruvate dehydrogenase (quinone)
MKGFALAATKVVLDGGVGRVLDLDRTNLRNIPRPRAERWTFGGVSRCV